MPFSRQIRSNSTSTGCGPKPAGEDLAVVGEDLVGDAVAAQRLGEDRADGLGGRPSDQTGSDAEPAVVIDAGDDLAARSPSCEQHPAHHVHLPQLHRTLPLPAAELVAALASASELDEAVALQAAVDRRARGHRVDTQSARAGVRSGEVPSQDAGGASRRSAPRSRERSGAGTCSAGGNDRRARPSRPARSVRSRCARSGVRPPGGRATSVTFQPSCTTASTAWYRCSMTLSSTSTAHLLSDLRD